MSVRLIASSRQKFTGEYINADDIKRASLCTDLEAAIKAEQLRETRFFRWENRFWSCADIAKLACISESQFEEYFH